MTNTKSNASKKGLGVLIAVAALLVAFALPMQASAQTVLSSGSCDPTDSQYAPPSGAIDCEPISGGGGGGTVVSSLPFTGMDILPMAAIALALGGAGLMIRRYGTGDSEKI